MTLELDLQIALDLPGLPAEADFRHWTEAALAGAGYTRDAELTLRVVNEAECAALNEAYRHKQGPTNVLSFPFVAPPEVESALLGDIVICPSRAEEPLETLAIHGLLHLLGYDHETDEGEMLRLQDVLVDARGAAEGA